MTCLFCEGTPSTAELEQIYIRNFPAWMCKSCIEYLGKQGSLEPLCSFCHQTDDHCECQIRQIAAAEASPNYGEFVSILAEELDDETEPTNECITCGLTFDLDDLDQDNECWGCVFSSGKEVANSICYFCKGVPSDEDLERIADREYPSWLCAACIDYLENKGGFVEEGLHEERIWSWLCRECDTNPVVDRLDT
jgi:hypothetical protein